MRKRLLAIVATLAMVMTMIPSVAFADTTVATLNGVEYTSLQAAIDKASESAGDYEIALAAGTLDEDVTITQKKGINITIKGNETTYTGTIDILGSSRSSGTETITIEGVDFSTSEDNHYFIYTYKSPSEKRYAHNLTLKNCTFKSTAEKKYPAIYWRTAYKLDIVDCEADGFSSLVWNSGGAGPITVENTKIRNCGNGIVASFAGKLSVTNCDIETPGVAIVTEGTAGRELVVTGGTIKGEIPVLVRNTTSDTFKLTIDETVDMEAKNEDGYLIMITKSNGTEFVAPEVEPTISVPENIMAGLEDGFIFVAKEPVQPNEPQQPEGPSQPTDTTQPTTPTAPTTPAEKPAGSPKTGDDFNMAVPMALAGLAVAAMAAVVMTRRKQGQK